MSVSAKPLLADKNFGKDARLQTTLAAMVAHSDEVSFRSLLWGALFAALLVGSRAASAHSRCVRSPPLAAALRLMKPAGPILVCLLGIAVTAGGQWATPQCFPGRGDVHPADLGPASPLQAQSASGCVKLTAASPKPWPPYARWRGLEITGRMDSGLPSLGLDLRWDLLSPGLLSAVALVAVVGSLETVAIGKGLAVKLRQPGYCANQEWLAMGAMNVASALFGGFPAAGSFSRSALNAECEATSPVSVAVVFCLVGLTLSFLMPLFEYLPKAALAALVCVALTGLADPHEVAWLLRHDRRDAALWAATFCGVLFIGVEGGVALGVAASVAALLAEAAAGAVAQPAARRAALDAEGRSPLAGPGECSPLADAQSVVAVSGPITFVVAETVCPAGLRKAPAPSLIPPPGLSRCANALPPRRLRRLCAALCRSPARPLHRASLQIFALCLISTPPGSVRWRYGANPSPSSVCHVLRCGGTVATQSCNPAPSQDAAGRLRQSGLLLQCFGPPPRSARSLAACGAFRLRRGVKLRSRAPHACILNR